MLDTANPTETETETARAILGAAPTPRLRPLAWLDDAELTRAWQRVILLDERQRRILRAEERQSDEVWTTIDSLTFDDSGHPLPSSSMTSEQRAGFKRARARHSELHNELMRHYHQSHRLHLLWMALIGEINRREQRQFAELRARCLGLISSATSDQ